VNNSERFGRWAFAEFTEVFGMETDFAARVESEFRKIVDSVS
jgi:type III restriction enzyme